jgi:ribokinase
MVISAVCSGIGGMLGVAYFGSAQQNEFDTYLLDAIAAVVVGGTSLFGGRGGIGNTIVGLFVLGVLNNGLDHVNIDSFLKILIRGLILLAALIINVYAQKLRSTGVALVLSETSGENSIAIAAGANDFLLPADIDAAADELAEASIVVCQFESPVATIERLIEIAKKCGVPVLLNPAPARPVTDAMLKGIRFLVPNRHELADLTGLQTGTVADVEAAAKILLARGVQTVITTLGREGVLRATVDGARVIPAPVVQAVDTTGAGDTFVGARAVSIFCESKGFT